MVVSNSNSLSPIAKLLMQRKKNYLHYSGFGQIYIFVCLFHSPNLQISKARNHCSTILVDNRMFRRLVSLQDRFKLHGGVETYTQYPNATLRKMFEKVQNFLLPPQLNHRVSLIREGRQPVPALNGGRQSTFVFL